MLNLTLSILPDPFAICRLDPHSPVPLWATSGVFVSITYTPEELSIVCPQENVPHAIQSERNWRCLKVDGPLDFALTGILASLSGLLADAKISLFAVSTFDTDYLLVKSESLTAAIQVLRQGGHQIQNPPE